MTSLDRVKVLFIAGSGRSGSTLLGNVLGEIDGFFFAGELRFLWERGLIEDRLCGCGNRFRSCPTWLKILEEAFGGADALDPRALIRTQRQGVRIRHLPLILGSRRRDLIAPRIGDQYEILSRLYRAIRDVTGSRVVVDSSKLPAYGNLLDRAPSIDLRVVHLIRDPRAAAYSWLRKKAQPDRGTPGLMERQGPLRSSLLWTTWNAAAEALWRRHPERYLRLRYEDLIADPPRAIRRILRLADEHPSTLPFIAPRSVSLSGNHTVAGNPDRLATGAVELHPDVEWIVRMRPRDLVLVTAATAPLLERYGYPFRRGGAR
ncbi:MAG: sulfotransferase [Actinomycetota bacterium]